MARRAFLFVAASIVHAAADTSASSSPSADAGWRRILRDNPAHFESRVLRSLDGALTRVQELSARRWPWQRGDRAMLEPTGTSFGGWRREGDALRLLLTASSAGELSAIQSSAGELSLL